MAATPIGMETVILAIILGTLAGIVYSLRVLVLVERRISRIDLNIESLTRKILVQELRIEDEEKKIESEEKNLERKLGSKSKSKSSKKPKRR